MKRFSSEGIILKRLSFGEADRILTVYSKDYGKLTLLAKGVRKLGSRKRGSVEVFSCIKFSAIQGKVWDIVIETQLKESYQGVRRDLKKASVAYFFLETIDKLVHGEEEHQALYKLLTKYLERINFFTSSLKIVRQDFILESLIEMGFWPEGKEMVSPDSVLQEILERKMSTVRVGKILQA